MDDFERKLQDWKITVIRAKCKGPSAPQPQIHNRNLTLDPKFKATLRSVGFGSGSGALGFGVRVEACRAQMVCITCKGLGFRLQGLGEGFR